MRRAKNTIARISEENSKQNSIQASLDHTPTNKARQGKPTTILFGSSEKDVVNSNWQMCTYENQAVKHMMTRKVKLINQKAEDTHDPKKTFLFSEN